MFRGSVYFGVAPDLPRDHEVLRSGLGEAGVWPITCDDGLCHMIEGLLRGIPLNGILFGELPAAHVIQEGA